jgi:hypothetical protein
MKKKRVAFCLRGAVSRKLHKLEYPGQILIEPNYIHVECTHKAIKKHIFDCNQEYEFDTFIHCWDKPMEEKLLGLYNPKGYLFEDNSIYWEEIQAKIANPQQYSQGSQLLTMKKVLELKEKYEQDNNFKYDMVILFRPDVLLWKNMTLENYDVNNYMYVTRWDGDSQADFHFVMSSLHADQFKYAYDKLNKSIYKLVHFYIKFYIVNYMYATLLEDDIRAGIHEEVIRIIKLPLFTNKSISMEQLEEYGLTEKMLEDYQSTNF